VKITRLRITGGFEGLESLDEEFGPGLTVIEGRNGSGKTSTLHAIAAAITNSTEGARTVLAHNGEDGGVIFVQFDNGMKGNRRVKPGGTSAGPIQLRDGDGRPISAPQGELNKLFAGFGFNPLGFLDLAPKEQTQELLRVIDVDLPMEEMRRLTDGEVGKIDYEVHPLAFLNAAGQYLEEYRRDVNRDAKKCRSTAEELRKVVPGDFKAESIVDFDLGAETAKLTNAKRVESEIENQSARLGEIEGRITALKEELIRLEAQQEEVSASLESLRSQRVDVEPIQASIGLFQENRGYLQDLETANEKVREAVRLEARSRRLTELLDEVRGKPAELLRTVELPVEGLGINEEGIVVIAGRPISSLSTSEQLRVATEIAIRTLGELKIILIDGLEALDNDNQDTLLCRLVEAGVQAFITKVSDGELTIITDYQPGDKIPF
jgi:DNA repair exonuclease SbcCD ATPase subunit